MTDGSGEIAKTVAIILAAGQGKRMKSTLPKAMMKVGGVPMADMVYKAVSRAGIGRCIMVVGYGADAVRDYFKDSVEYAVQNRQLGTGHAALAALDYLDAVNRETADCGATDGFDGRVLVLYGDMPLISAETIRKIVDGSASAGEASALLFADMPDSKGYGRIVRVGRDGDEAGRFLRIVEQSDATEEEARITEVNVGVYCFDARTARAALTELVASERANAQGEVYLTDVHETILKKKWGRVGLYELADISEAAGPNDRVALSALNRFVWDKKCEKLMRESGVSIMDPRTTYIDIDVEVGADTVIYPGCVIEGGTVIGIGAEIGPYSKISDSEVGDGARVVSSVVSSARVEERATVGPYAYLRPGSVIQAGAKIGDFVEIKNATIGEKTSVAHLTYIGDADVGKNVNIGCGTITCNYDGRHKHRTTIGDNAFIGSNTNLIAPVKVNAGAYIASGSTITREVPGDALAIARAKQVVKENWVSEKGYSRGNNGRIQ